MAIYSGKLGYFMMGYMANPTPVTPNISLPVTDANFDTQPTHTYAKEFRKQMESTSKPIRTGQESTGTTKTSAYPGGGGLEHLFYAVFGAVNSTPLGPKVIQHTCTPNQSDIPAWTMGLGFSTVTPDVFPYAKAKTLKMSLAKDTALDLEVEWISKGVQRNFGELTPSYTTPPALTYLDASVSIDGVASTLVESLDMTIDRATEATKTMNASRDPTYILPTDMKTSGTMQLIFDTDSEYKRFLGDPVAPATSMRAQATPVTVNITLTGAYIETISTTPYYQKMSMDLQEVYYDKINFDPLTDGTVKIGFDWTAAKPLNATPSNRVQFQTTAASPLVS